MKSGDVRITCEWIQAGQPRPYADSIYEFKLYIEWIPYAGGGSEFKPSEFDDNVAKHYAKSFHNFYEKGENKEWHQPVLAEFKRLAQGLWHFKIVETYTD